MNKPYVLIQGVAKEEGFEDLSYRVVKNTAGNLVLETATTYDAMGEPKWTDDAIEHYDFYHIIWDLAAKLSSRI